MVVTHQESVAEAAENRTFRERDPLPTSTSAGRQGPRGGRDLQRRARASPSASPTTRRCWLPVAGLTAEGNTAFYDSLIFTLHYFGGLKGKRALIILTDGIDEGSRYGFQDALEYARRSGVAIYTIGIDIGTKEADARMKMERLASETGGRHFFIEQAGDLKRVYAEVEADLRTQYLLTYQSASEGKGKKYRTVEVEVKRPGLKAKTLKGYYP